MLDRDTILQFDRFLQASYERGNCWQYELIDEKTIAELISQAKQFDRWHRRTFPVQTTEGSQHEEDEIIANLFPPSNEPDDRSGVYVDIGAGDPVSCSNTWKLYQRGWRGLLVEPHRDYVFRLLDKRPGDRIYPVAASDRTGWAVMRILASMSSLRTDWNIAEQCQTFVRTEKTSELLARFCSIRDRCDLCSIDVEGHERQVLEAIDWTLFNPSVVVVEYKKYSPQPPHEDLTVEWEPILTEQGYELHAMTKMNKVYVRS